MAYVQDEERYCPHDMLYQTFNNVRNVDLVVLGAIANDPCHLSCISAFDLSAHLRMTSKIAHEYDSFLDAEDILQTALGEICMGKLQNHGYIRCKNLVESNGDSNMVYAIDYGFVCSIQTDTFA